MIVRYDLRERPVEAGDFGTIVDEAKSIVVVKLEVVETKMVVSSGFFQHQNDVLGEFLAGEGGVSG